MRTRDWLFLTPLHSFGDLGMLGVRFLTGAFLIHGVWDNISEPARMAAFARFLKAHGFALPQLMAPLSVYAQGAIGVALVLGLFTRWAGILLMGNFLMALAMVHWGEAPRAQWPAAVLVALGLLFATGGAGALSLDRLASGRPGRGRRRA